MPIPTRMLVSLLALTAVPALAREDEAWTLKSPDLAAAMRKQPEPTVADGQPIDSRPPRPNFGDPGSRWWTIGGGVSLDFSDATDLNLFGDFTYFIGRNVEFTAELGAWYFNQDGPDAVGINPEMIFRWHFYNEGRTTFFGDLGIGLVFSSDNVPDGGTTYNFLPRIGGGMTYALTEDLGGPRLQLGVRWHHISNGRSNGDSDNPSRDGLMLYTGVVFPF